MTVGITLLCLLEMCVFQTKTNDSVDAMKQLEQNCRQNSLSMALLSMEKAQLMHGWDSDVNFPKNCIEAGAFAFSNVDLIL